MSLLRVWDRFARLVGTGAAPLPSETPSPAERRQALRDGEMALLPVDALLDTQRALLARIKLCHGSDTLTFERDVLQPVRRYAAFVNALPASAEDYFAECGGLLRLGLETAFFALQATDAQIFAGRETISNRRQLEPRWRQAAFIAGLCAELHRTLQCIEVTADDGIPWRPYLGALTEWPPARALRRVRVRWRTGLDTRALGLFALPHVVPAATLCDLAHENDVIVPHLLATIAGAASYHEHNVMEHLVRHAAALVIDRDLRRRHGEAARQKAHGHLLRYLVDAMRELLLTRQCWQPNAERSRLWYGSDGLFMIWPNGMTDVLSLLQDERLAGVPETPALALDILVRAGLLVHRRENVWVWEIDIPGGAEPQQVVRFFAPEMLLRVLAPPPAPLAQALLRPCPSAPAPGGAQAPASDAPKRDQVGEGREGPPAKTQPVDAGMQLPLPAIPAAARGQAGGDAATPGVKPAKRAGKQHPRRFRADGTPAVPGTHWCLRAPLRLNPVVARALAEFVGTRSPQGSGEAGMPGDGALFVPFAALSERKVDVQVAVRALTDAGMLVTAPSAAPTAGEGVWLDARCVVSAETPFDNLAGNGGEGGDAAASV